MGCRILYDAKHDQACLYCSTTMTAFGPIFSALESEQDSGVTVLQSAHEAAEVFCRWLDNDPRKYTHMELMDLYVKWYRQATTTHEYRPVEIQTSPASKYPQVVCRVCGEDEEMHALPENVP